MGNTPTLKTNISNTYGLARQLVWLWRKRTEELQHNPRTKRCTIAAAQFNGACEAAHAVGYGITAEQVRIIVRETVRVVAGDDLNGWYTTEVVNEVAEQLSDVGWDGGTV